MAGKFDALKSALIAAGVAADLAERLAAYGAMLLEANANVNLTGAKDTAALVPHLLDALTMAGDVRESLVDIGSGGGLPGIPLALATGARIVLVEPIAKKAAFLSRAIADLGIDGVAFPQRAEVVARDDAFRERFAFATARAVSGASTVAELTVPFLRIGGKSLLQRGALSDAERQAVDDAAPILGAALIEERIIDGDRRLLVLEKRVPTGPRFPRRNGVPEKRPLCV